MGDGIAGASLNDLLGQEAHGPVVMAVGRITTRQRGDLGTLNPGNADRAAGARRIAEVAEQMKAIRDLCGLGRATGGAIREITTSVTGDHLNRWTRLYPRNALPLLASASPQWNTLRSLTRPIPSMA